MNIFRVPVPFPVPLPNILGNTGSRWRRILWTIEEDKCTSNLLAVNQTPELVYKGNSVERTVGAK